MDYQSSLLWTEADLQEVKEKFNQLSSVDFDGILVHNKVKILQADPSVAAMFGYTAAELINQTLLDLSTPESREIVLKHTLTGYDDPYEAIGLNKNGTDFPIEIFSRPIAYHGRTVRVMGIRNIVERTPEEVRAAVQRARHDLELSGEDGLGTTTQLRYSNERLRLELDERAQMETQLRDRARQQAAVAELGQRALVGTELDLLMDEAVSTVGQTLRVEYAQIQELLPDDDHLLVKAGFGWADEVVGRTTTEAYAGFQAGYTLLSGGPVIVEDMAEESRFRPSELLKTYQVVSGASVIIFGREKPFGVLSAHTAQLKIFTEDDVHFLQAVANVLATAIENAHLYQETQRRAAQLTVLNELDRAITTSLRLSDIFYAFTRHAIRLIPYELTSIALLENEQARIVYRVDRTKKVNELPVDTRLSLQNSAVGWVLAEGQPLLRHNIPEDVRFEEDDRLIAGEIRSSMIIPLRVKTQVLGTWNIGSNRVGAYSPDDLEIAQSMADQLAISIENARLFQKAKEEIAERQRAEAELAQERALLAQRVEERTMDYMAANAELARAARLKDEFLASMSHELRTPLTAVLGMVEILKMEVYGPLTEQQVKSLDVIDESGRHLLELINDILDLSKIEADKLELEIEPVSVESVCQSSLQFIRQTALNKYIEVSFEHDTTVSVLHVDERRFKQILVNLLSNAVKFTPDEGRVGLEVVADPARQRARFVVWDTGIGIAAEDVERLFQPFVQLDSKLARQYSGTGLGLALVNRMVKMHGGEIAVESEPGKGSRFTVSIPWSGTTITPATIQPARSYHKVPQEPVVTVQLPRQIPSVRGESPLVLLAEDEHTTTMLITDFLQMSGYQVVSAENGIRAIERAKAEKPDIILMDIQMPEMDGLETIQHLRADEQTANVPIIALTALAMAGDRERCLAAGANDYLSKPIDLSRLALCIDKHLNQSAA
jgi:PAS domain S-box-containing protein